MCDAESRRDHAGKCTRSVSVRHMEDCSVVMWIVVHAGLFAVTYLLLDMVLGVHHDRSESEVEQGV